MHGSLCRHTYELFAYPHSHAKCRESALERVTIEIHDDFKCRTTDQRLLINVVEESLFSLLYVYDMC